MSSVSESNPLLLSATRKERYSGGNEKDDDYINPEISTKTVELHLNGGSSSEPKQRPSTSIVSSMIALLGSALLVSLACLIYYQVTPSLSESSNNPLFPPEPSSLWGPLLYNYDDDHHNRQEPLSFPSHFHFGVATSAYQIEGASDLRGETVWDTFCRQEGTISDNSTADTTCDHYHMMKSDVDQLLHKGLNVTAYRFSISWSRILPTGTLDGSINKEGLQFYSDLIDQLLARQIEPIVTLFHWDTPQALEKSIGGWLNKSMIDFFVQHYARTVFDEFASRVAYWITINEPWTIAVNGYGTGVHSPGHISSTEPYIVAHHLILAHASTAVLYKNEYGHLAPMGQGVIGMANCGDFRYPLNPQSQLDRTAADNAMLFQMGWFQDPFAFGNYPLVMRQRVGSRLPKFTELERALLWAGRPDFIGLNYYSSLLATKRKDTSGFTNYWTDMPVKLSKDPSLRQNSMGWTVDPAGLHRMLLWLHQRYHRPLIYVTETGTAEVDTMIENGFTEDDHRVEYFQMHIQAVSRAIQRGNVDVQGFFAWSLMDNFGMYPFLCSYPLFAINLTLLRCLDAVC